MSEESKQSPEIRSRRLFSIEYDDHDGLSNPLHGEPIIDLYRSLTIGGVVAYVGSGNSMMLGYKSWDDLSKYMIVLAAGKADNLDVMARLRTTFKRAARLSEIEAKNYEIGISDRLALAEEMLRQSSAEGDEKRALAMYRFFEPPDTLSIKYAEKAVEGLVSNEHFSGCAIKLLRGIKALGNHAYVPIDYVSAIKLATAITGFSQDIRSLEKLSKKDKFLETPSPTIDVLTTLRKEWKISRFATLNYDFEIERMLERTDFPHESMTPKFNISRLTSEMLWEEAHRSHKLTARSRLGEKALSVDLKRSNVGEFLMFAADSPVGVSRVLHLHGSIRHPSQMIVTDTDYNQRYFVDAPWNQILQESQELLYGANPIVFIGVGMSEEVLFRAMRMISQAPESEARPVYAFLMSRNEIKDAADYIKYFRRYGIRTIFYGTCLGRSMHQEAEDFHLHPLVQAAFRKLYPSVANHKDPQSTELLKNLATRLSPLSFELSYLEAIEIRLEAIKAEKPSARKKRIKIEISAIEKKMEEKIGIGSKSVSAESPFTICELPRLMLTPWHSDVFRLILKTLHAKDNGVSVLMNDGILKALIDAVSSLKSAIHSRALQDELQAISAGSVEWQKRWKYRPLRAHSTTDLGKWHFRSPANARFDLRVERVCSHNISCPHPEESRNRKFLRTILKDESGTSRHNDASVLMGQYQVVVARAMNGGGEGMLEASFMEKDCPVESGRLILSFRQCCEYDCLFDLMAYWHPAYTVKLARGAPRQMQYIVSHLDIVISNIEIRPKRAEWDVFFRNFISRQGARWLFLCGNIEAVEYFMSLDVSRHGLPGARAENDLQEMMNGETFHECLIDHVDTFRSEVFGQPTLGTSIDDGSKRRMWEILLIARSCCSVWVASFLTSVYAELVPERTNSAGERAQSVPEESVNVGADRFDDILRRIQNKMSITRDPHQRIPYLIDVTITQIETYVLHRGDAGARIKKDISHAILKHMFAFDGPVDGSVFASCPDFRSIMHSYSNKIRCVDALQAEIKKAMEWLRRLGLVTELTDCYSRNFGVCYGLHTHVRNWLAIKAGYSFSIVAGREPTPITVLPLIDDDIVPLEREDYGFIWDTVDGLISPLEDGSAAPYPQVRAAYMLLRGSMRIGSILRSAHGNDQEEIPGRTTLDDYLRRLLDLRHAALRCAARDPDDGEPLFEREWVWLFNELGVVKLLRGQVHDASTLFEQAIEFETDRLRAGGGFEQLIYADRGLPDFSVSKLRIMMNLAMAEIERGAFDRAGRIISSEKRNISELIELFCDNSDRVPESQRVHREIRILNLVLGLVDARLKFLCGKTGEARQWLETNETRTVGEGFHGLTALYYLIGADVESGRRNHAAAAEMFATARAEAEASGRNDLIFSAMLGEIGLQMVMPEESDAKLWQQRMAMRRQPRASQLQHQLALIRKIKHEAERLGMSRIVVTACMLRARLYMGFGEFRSARQDLMTALTKATNCGLHLKRTSALIDMAALVGALDASLREEARDIARSARFDAERMGYKLAAARAKDLELVLREQGSIEDWLFRAGAEKNGVRDEGG